MNTRKLPEEVLLPIDVQKEGRKFFVVSARLPRRRFTDPFFVESLLYEGILDPGQKAPKEDVALARPLHYHKGDERIVYIPAEEFVRQHAGTETGKKAGFIFHTSRCGSTLATQMLAASDRCFVLSEPTVVNAIFNPALKIPPAQRKAIFEAAVRCLGKCAPEESEFFFIKFRSWNTFFLKEATEGFPQVPWVFMHRNGAEVLASVLAKPPGWLRSKSTYADFFTRRLELSARRVKRMGIDEFTARMLGAFCHSAISAMTADSYHIDYENMPNEFLKLMDENWRMNLSESEKNAMLASTELYSKDPTRRMKFIPDTEAKLGIITPKQMRLSERYVEVERRRLPVLESSLNRELKLL